MLRVGFLFTYLAPLVFVIAVTMANEAYDDFKRFLRDKDLNNKEYKRVGIDGTEETITSEHIKVGDII